MRSQEPQHEVPLSAVWDEVRLISVEGIRLVAVEGQLQVGSYRCRLPSLTIQDWHPLCTYYEKRHELCSYNVELLIYNENLGSNPQHHLKQQQHQGRGGRGSREAVGRHEDTGNQTPVLGKSNKCPSPLNHLSGPLYRS